MDSQEQEHTHAGRSVWKPLPITQERNDGDLEQSARRVGVEVDGS